LQVRALQISRVLENGGVNVEIAVLRGLSHEVEEKVETLRLEPGQRARVTKVRRFGLEPIELSLTAAMPATLFVPNVTSISADIEIANVELLSAPYPGYRITARNIGGRAAANFQVQSHRSRPCCGTTGRSPESHTRRRTPSSSMPAGAIS
jgi:hypothetical protein